MLIQSMTSTDTLNTKSTVQQCIKMFETGCKLIRISAPSVKAAQNLSEIKKELAKQGYNIPLVADIHFNPKAAEIAARIVEKIRINPGNFADSKKKAKRTDLTVQNELEEISSKLIPLLNVCKKHHTAIRIGVNHGSLSKRILFQHGNTPGGMVESALEYLQICRQNDFHDIVLSLKASNIITMIQSNRLMVKKMQERGWDYPLHLGVTEAGNATEGRIKSAAGIGSLLREGIGDTIRVSLTENPLHEIPVAKKIIQYAQKQPAHLETWWMERPDDTDLPLVLNNKKNMADLFVRDELAYDQMQHRYAMEKAQRSASGKLSGKLKILKASYPGLALEDIMIRATMDFTKPLITNQCDGIWIEGDEEIPADKINEIAFGILQATKRRITKTEFISCPSCARTLFDIEKLLEKVKKNTSHLKGLKIGVMGCTVNGPGEMAGADYGLVGSGKNQVTLYKGQNIQKKNIPLEKAVKELIKLIKENKEWQD